jgi:hypothetical protein
MKLLQAMIVDPKHLFFSFHHLKMEVQPSQGQLACIEEPVGSVCLLNCVA